MNIVSVNWLELLGIWLFGGVMDLIVTVLIFYISNSLYYGRDFVREYVKAYDEDMHVHLDDPNCRWAFVVSLISALIIDLLFWPYKIPRLFSAFDKELQEISEQL